MANYNRCISGVTEALGREPTDGELELIFQQAQQRTRRFERAGMNPTEAAFAAGRELGSDMRLAASIERRNLLINAARKKEIQAELRPGKETVDLRRVLNRIDANVYGAQSEVLGPLVNELREAGLAKVISRGDRVFDQRVIDELWSIENGGKAVTGDKQARLAAEIIDRAQERARSMQNAAGSWIAKNDHYVTRQAHDMDKIRGTLKKADGTPDVEANFAAWRDFILPRLDEKTFDHIPDNSEAGVNSYLRRVWDALSTGVHQTSDGRMVLEGFKGPGNLAKRVSQERKLLFADAKGWGEYQRQFGEGTLWENIVGGLNSGARNSALMNGLGTNPEAMFKTITNDARDAAVRRSDHIAADKLGNTFNEKVLDTVTGKANIPGNSTFAQFGRAATTVQTLSKLGGVVLSSLPDLAVNAAALRHNGIGLFDSYVNQFKALLPKSAEQKQVAGALGVGVDAMLGHMATRFTTAEGLRGKSAKLVDLFHRANLLTWWTDSLKFGVGSILSQNMGRLANTAFDGLDPRMQNTMRLYNITAKDWDIARATAGKAADGVVRVLPGEIEDAAVRAKFFTYTTDQIREAMTEPDAVSRTVATAGTQANTAVGVAVRMMTQFKTYPITFINRTLGREGLNPFADNFRSGRHGEMDAFGIAHLVVATSLMGYLAMEMKNLARGRNPRTVDAINDPSQAAYGKLVAAAMVQGGGLGLLGDFIFGEKDRTGGGFLTNLIAGPTVGTFDQLGGEVQNLLTWAREGDERALKDARSGALGLIRNNTPFINMFYTRALADYLIWYRLQEAANPGYLQRYEDRMRREQHQTFLLSPTVSQ